MVNYYNHQQTVKDSIIAFMRQKGYSRSTLSKLTNIPRSAIDQLLLQGEEDIDISTYNAYILQINQRFNFPEENLLKVEPKPNLLPPPHAQPEKNARTQEIFDGFNGLEEILDIFQMYLKKK
ncbi:hypothetical protein [Paenibacillus sp. DR312]|uniref:hypothetical protein n=1 Tax=unclassified Paenibacillus TaxID=185978 RepID=UPI001C93AD34|nr:hypothetical protein [Paenibacillus sp. DR312]QZN76224.1 hypothetical protein K5K90_02630 [Paenibacillus sp. DR312]